MKKITTLLALAFCLDAGAQYVTIPDAHFVNWLHIYVSAAMSGNQMDTTSPAVTTLTAINLGSDDTIADLTGLQYFDALQTFYCWGYPTTNTFPTFPRLPNTIQQLWCGGSIGLSSLPALPNSLTSLRIWECPLASLPTLPSSLTELQVSNCQVSSLPSLPPSLQILYCYNSSGYPYNNTITSLPVLPSALTHLYCYGNQISSLPTLPNSITDLECGFNSISSLPTLPTSLQILSCDSNHLTSLPTLPTTLQQLTCNNNHITALPILPSGLTTLICSYNHINCFAAFSSSLSLNISHNPFTCLPNYTLKMDSTTLSYPLCGSGNTYGCPNSTDCTPAGTFSLTADITPHYWDAHPAYSANTINTRWYWGDGTSTTGLYPSHIYPNPGFYNICVATYSSCGDSSKYCIADSLYRLANNSPYNTMVYINVDSTNNYTTGINKLVRSNELNIYPNPNNGSFVIEPQNTLYNVHCTVYDVNGKAVLSQTINGKTTIDAGSLNEGVYNISLQSNEGVINKRLVIVR